MQPPKHVPVWVLSLVLLLASARSDAQQAPTPPPSKLPSPPAEPLPPPVPGGDATQPRFFIKAEKGFIDDPFDLAPEAGVLAVLLTDAASFARIDLVDLATGKPKSTIGVGDPQRLFERVVVADGNAGVVLISRDAGTGRRSAQYYDGEGKAAGILGPFDEIGVVRDQSGQRVLIAITHASGRDADTYKVSRHAVRGLGRVGKQNSFTLTKGGDLRRPPLKVAAWQRGFSEIVGLEPGSYDKARDFRLPDRGAILDTQSGEITWRADVGDVVAWAASTQLRKKMPGRGLFAVFSPDTHIFDLVDFQGRRGAIQLPVPLRYYDPSTLQEQEDFAGGTLLFSLAIDPLHAEALARRKKDHAFLDLYLARPAAGRTQAPTGKAPLDVTVERLLRAPMDDRPATWTASGGHAAVLRKHKNFSRGGNLLEVYLLERAAPKL
jgi:hypothetical protein